MPIVGFNFNNISAKKNKPVEGDVKVKSDVSITNLKEEKLPTGKNKSDGLRIDFKLMVIYEPEIGNLTLEGFIFYMDDPKTLKDIVKQYKKDKNLPVDLTTQVINAVLTRATIKALMLAQEVNLPPHIPLPAVQQEKVNPKNYIG